MATENKKNNKNADLRGIFEIIVQKYGEGEFTRDQFLDLLVDAANGKDLGFKPVQKLETIRVDHTTTQPLVQIMNVTKHYKGRPKPAIEDISFNIYPGQFHTFIGANGAGKTTTIKSIIGAYAKANVKGSILVNGGSNHTVAAKKLIGYIPEAAIFPKKMTTIDYLMSMTMLAGFTKSDAKQIVTKTLKKLNIESLANKCPSSFSSGQKKKILLAQSLVHDPQILIMDEPAANLDPLARDELFATLVQLQNEGKAIFISSHILDEVGKYATYATILDGGKVVFDGPINKGVNLSELYRKYVKLGSVDTQSDNKAQ